MREVVFFDIDGTLADITHRISNLDSKGPYHWEPEFDWHKFMKGYEDDQPILSGVAILKAFASLEDYEIAIFTARSHDVFEQTSSWLAQFDIPYNYLLMREKGDYRRDLEVKLSLIEPYKKKVAFIFEDRLDISKGLFESGYKVYCCGDFKDEWLLSIDQ